MPASRNVNPLQRAKEHAFYSLSYSERQTTNLYINQGVAPGEPVGPPFQEISAAEASIVVFADMEPRSGFGHRCRYLFYDPKTGAFQRMLEGQFPPAENLFEPFHLPVRVSSTKTFRVRPPLLCPHLVPDGERYAILFSGWAFPANLNDLEFSYRTIVDRYGFRRRTCTSICSTARSPLRRDPPASGRATERHSGCRSQGRALEPLFSRL
jgi:hypothetical protein